MLDHLHSLWLVNRCLQWWHVPKAKYRAGGPRGGGVRPSGRGWSNGVSCTVKWNKFVCNSFARACKIVAAFILFYCTWSHTMKRDLVQRTLHHWMFNIGWKSGMPSLLYYFCNMNPATSAWPAHVTDEAGYDRSGGSSHRRGLCIWIWINAWNM